MCLADVAWPDGSDVRASPRQILRGQLARLAERGWRANAGTELEFMVFRDTYEQAWHKGYRELEPANLYNVDYSLLGHRARGAADPPHPQQHGGAGMVCEDSKGECNFGQHEINFRYADALRTADEHAIYKNGAKEIAAQEGMAITFMAKYDQREGNSCHIHFSLADDRRAPAVPPRAGAVRVVPRRAARVPARADAAARAQRQLLQALRGATVRADGGRLGPRQPHLRAARRRPGSVAALREPRRRRGPEPLHGAQRDHRRRPARGRAGPRARAGVRGQRLRGRTSSRGCRASLRDARELFAASEIARAAFGDDVVDSLRQRRRRGARGVRFGGHRLGALRGFERL